MNSDLPPYPSESLSQELFGLDATSKPLDVPAATQRLSRIMEVLVAQGREFHLDDAPDTIVGDDMETPIFSASEAEFLAEELGNIRQVLGSNLMWDIAAPYFGLSNDEDKVEQTQAQTVGRGPRMG